MWLSSTYPPPTPILTTPQQAANYVAETVQGAGATASKEAHKEVAKDSEASWSTRASAAVDAVGDKKDEQVHNTKADVHKGKPSTEPFLLRASLMRFTEAAKH